jgi:uncharacterized protein RhaS with RHS repeats
VSEDPIGIAGGLNLSQYVFSNPVSFTDPSGLDVTVSRYPGAVGFGHVGAGVNSPNTTGFYPAPGSSNAAVATGQAVPGAMLPDTLQPVETIVIPTTPAQDQAVQQIINQRTANPGNYVVNQRNCTTTVIQALQAAGINCPQTIYPRTLMRNLRSGACNIPQLNRP